MLLLSYYIIIIIISKSKYQFVISFNASKRLTILLHIQVYIFSLQLVKKKCQLCPKAVSRFLSTQIFLEKNG
jgi:hypothetical protein